MHGGPRVLSKLLQALLERTGQPAPQVAALLRATTNLIVFTLFNTLWCKTLQMYRGDGPSESDMATPLPAHIAPTCSLPLIVCLPSRCTVMTA